ncbi:hypothetical protein C0584_02375 [Candidatus Parcubacteria bacterium]|nr:MAG: hypothetical protein C0584_02375 [Candidatus Parcubacteria bacterium]
MNKKIYFSILFVIIFPLYTSANTGNIQINELAWMGTETSANDEWIELYNPGTDNISLEGWRISSRDGQPDILLNGMIEAGGYFLLERTDDSSVLGVVANQIYSGSLSNTGEYLELFDSEQRVVDFIDMSGAWLFGDNATKQTMQKILNTWQTSLEAGGSPGLENISGEKIIVLDQPEKTPPIEIITTIESGYIYGDLLITEIVSDPSDGELEWLEIFNKTKESVDLNGWYVKEGSGTKTLLNGIIGASQYFVLESPGGNLNNSGDEILLFTPDNKLINDVVYGDWNDGDLSDNAPLAKDPYSIARVTLKETRNNANDFELSLKKTRGEANIIQNEESIISNNEEEYDYGKTIILSEIFPNPIGDDKEGEFIEMYNYGDRDINLFGWRLGDASKNRFDFPRDIIIRAKNYLVLYREETGIALNNNGDEVKIFQAGAEEEFYLLKYIKAIEGESFDNTKTEEIENFYNKNFKEEFWVWSDEPSPGAKNIFKKINHIPEVDFSFPEKLFTGQPILFDASDSYDIDENTLEYLWDFGDGFVNTLESPEHTYFQEGIYNVTLQIFDGEATGTKEKILEIDNRFILDTKINEEPMEIGTAKIYITEVLPNPEGDDGEGEFVEIYNAGDMNIDLINWIVDDMEGGSKPYVIDTNRLVKPGEFLVLNRTESNIVLNNTYDKVRLIDPNKNIIDELEYSSTSNAKSFAREDSGEWVWTDEISPGKENIVTGYNENTEYITTSSGSGGYEYYSYKNPREAQNHSPGQTVLVEGVVNSTPGMFSSQYFYIEGDGGIQIYSYNKDFPDLEIGDYVQVRGEISRINKEGRIKTDKSEKIFKMDDGYTLTPFPLDLEIDQGLIGRLVNVEGEIVDIVGGKIMIENEHGNFAIEIKTGTDIQTKNFKIGDKLNIKGVVSSNKDGFKVLPRFMDDIKIIGGEKNKETGEVLGEYIEGNEWELEQKNNNRKYYIIILGFFLSIAFVFYVFKKTD